MTSLPNLLSLLRLPLALVFLQTNVWYRCVALILAMATDGLDGYLARRYRWHSRLGTVLDPLTDKFFVFFILTVLINEQRISVWEAAAMLCRDFSVILFGIYLMLVGGLAKYQFRAIWFGKVTTCMQFLVLMGLSLGKTFPFYLYGLFIVLGFLALIELYYSKPIATSQA